MTSDSDQIKALRRKQRELQKAFHSLTRGVAVFLEEIDKVMHGESTPARGRQIADLCNWLEIQNDSAMHIALGMSYVSISKLKGASAKKTKDNSDASQ